jgi:hypothetical protein
VSSGHCRRRQQAIRRSQLEQLVSDDLGGIEVFSCHGVAL